MKNRIIEIDILRGIAIILMVIFHTIVDLNEFYNYNISYLKGFWYYIGKISGIIFIFISGISSTLSRNNIKRGLKILGIGMFLTIVTYFYNPNLYIKFGILHFLGVCCLLYVIFKNCRGILLILIGTISLILGNIFSQINVPYSYLFPLGLSNMSFSSLDYYPIFPWIGIFIYGGAAGKVVYKNKKSIFKRKIELRFLPFIGKHSLIIYVIHQPILLLILRLIIS